MAVVSYSLSLLIIAQITQRMSRLQITRHLPAYRRQFPNAIKGNLQAGQTVCSIRLMSAKLTNRNPEHAENATTKDKLRPSSSFCTSPNLPDVSQHNKRRRLESGLDHIQGPPQLPPSYDDGDRMSALLLS